MEESEAVATLKQTLQDHLMEAFGTYQVDRDGDFVIQQPGVSAVTYVRPTDWVEGQTLVRVFSFTNVDMRVDQELTKFLVTTNANLIFGAFFLDEDAPRVGFRHTLLGDFLQRKELEVAVRAVVSTAEEYDDQIKERFGGRLFTES